MGHLLHSYVEVHEPIELSFGVVSGVVPGIDVQNGVHMLYGERMDFSVICPHWPSGFSDVVSNRNLFDSCVKLIIFLYGQYIIGICFVNFPKMQSHTQNGRFAAWCGVRVTITVASYFSVLTAEHNIIYCQIAVKKCQIIVSQIKYAAVMLIVCWLLMYSYTSAHSSGRRYYILPPKFLYFFSFFSFAAGSPRWLYRQGTFLAQMVGYRCNLKNWVENLGSDPH